MAREVRSLLYVLISLNGAILAFWVVVSTDPMLAAEPIPRALLVLLSSPYIPMMIFGIISGICFGVGVRRLQKLKNPDLLTVALAAMGVFFVLVALFKSELQTIVARVDEVSGAGLSIGFRNENELLAVDKNLNAPLKYSSRQLQTPFSVGAETFSVAFERFSDDYKAIRDLCIISAKSTDESEYCESALELKPIFCPPFPDLGEYNEDGCVFRYDAELPPTHEISSLSTCARKDLDDQFNAFLCRQFWYLRSLLPFRNCLQGGTVLRFYEQAPASRKYIQSYSEIFPNGIPIQDELSDLASTLILSANTGSANNNDKFLLELQTVADRVKSFRTSLSSYGKYTSPNDRPETIVEAADACSILADESVQNDISQRRRDFYDQFSNYPSVYLSILQSGVIIASGYKKSAGKHIERRLEQLDKKRHSELLQIGGSIEERLGKLIDIYSILRLNHTLEQIWEFGREPTLQTKAASHVEKQTADLLNLLSNDNSRSVIDYLEECIESRSHFALKLPTTESDSKTIESAQKEIISRHFTSISTLAKRFYAFATNDKLDIEAADFLESKENSRRLALLSNQFFTRLQNCFESLEVVNSFYTKRLGFDLEATYGLMLINYVQRRQALRGELAQINSGLSYEISDNYYMCEARRFLTSARRKAQIKIEDERIADNADDVFVNVVNSLKALRAISLNCSN